MSKLTRVRVEFFSKIIASTRPASGASASGLPLGQPARAALRSIASARIAATPSGPASDRLRKCRILNPPPPGGGVSAADGGGGCETEVTPYRPLRRLRRHPPLAGK